MVVSASAIYKTPRGFSDMLMMSDGDVLTGLHFVGSLVGYGGGIKNKIALLEHERGLARCEEGMVLAQSGA